MDRGVVLLVSGASTTFHVPLMLHALPVVFLSLSFNLSSFPFIFLSYFSNVHSCPFLFLSFAHICMQFLCVLYACSFISFLRFWKRVYGSARGQSATNDYRWIVAKVSTITITPRRYDIIRRKFATHMTE